MKNLKILLIGISIMSIAACGGGGTENNSSDDNGKKEIESMFPDEGEMNSNNDKGIGKFTDVTLPENLNAQLADQGKGVYDLKCAACHRLEGDRLVGPSWKGVTSRREPAWILNFITNVDEMLSKDPVAMAQLEECLVRMPNQNLSDDDAYAVLEYMRKNDGVQ